MLHQVALSIMIAPTLYILSSPCLRVGQKLASAAISEIRVTNEADNQSIMTTLTN
jgi:hypothetical protein